MLFDMNKHKVVIWYPLGAFYSHFLMFRCLYLKAEILNGVWKPFSKLFQCPIFPCLNLKQDFLDIYRSFTLVFYLFWLWLLGVHNWEVGDHTTLATAFDNILVAVIGDIMCEKILLVVFIWSPISSINYLEAI